MTDAPEASDNRPTPRKRPDLRKGAAGAPTKLDPEIASGILRYIAAGNYLETAAGANGIPPATVRNWLKWGARYRQGYGPDGTGRRSPKHKVYAEFLAAYEQAEAEAEAAALLNIAKSGKEDWRAEAWRLERRHPARWGRWERQSVDLRAQIQSDMVGEGEAEAKEDPLPEAVLNDPSLARDMGELLSRAQQAIARRHRPGTSEENAGDQAAGEDS